MNQRIYTHQTTLDVTPDRALEIIRYKYFPATGYTITAVDDKKRQVVAELHPNKQVHCKATVDVKEVASKPQAALVDVRIVVDLPSGLLAKALTSFQKADHAVTLCESLNEVTKAAEQSA